MDKQIAFKVINRMVGEGHSFAMKYIYSEQIVTLIKEYTADPKLIKKTYARVRQALTSLGFSGSGARQVKPVNSQNGASSNG